jgi:manganese/iron transport system permease protein
MHYGLLAIISLTIVATLAAVGLFLAVGLLIAPGGTAFLVVKEFRSILAVSMAVALSAILGGAHLSFWLDSDPRTDRNPAVVGGLCGIFLVAPTEGTAIQRFDLTRNDSDAQPYITTAKLSCEAYEARSSR